VILLDTHVIVRLLSGDPRLGKRARATIDRVGRRDELFVSAISFWEIAMLVAKHRLELDTAPSSFRARALEDGVREAPIDGEIAIVAGELPSTHQDPADHLLVATAIVRGLTLLTADDVLLDWKLRGYRAQDATV